MQASKITPKKTYAIKHANDKLVRFVVSEVVQRRVDNTGSPHDYKSHVEGHLVGEHEKITLRPDQILGPFEDYAELLKTKEREDEQHRLAEQQKMNAALSCCRALYQKCGLPVPDLSHYNIPFRVNYGDGITVNKDGVALLNKLWEGGGDGH